MQDSDTLIEKEREELVEKKTKKNKERGTRRKGKERRDLGRYS